MEEKLLTQLLFRSNQHLQHQRIERRKASIRVVMASAGSFPVTLRGPVHPVLMGVVQTVELRVAQRLLHAGASNLQSRHAVDDVDRQTETVQLVADGELQRCVDVALLLVAAHVQGAWRIQRPCLRCDSRDTISSTAQLGPQHEPDGLRDRQTNAVRAPCSHPEGREAA